MAGEARDRLGYGLAFFAIYVVWGTTFLAIRIAVAEMPPLFAAGVRFFVAGALLLGWVGARGARRAQPVGASAGTLWPTRRQWRNMGLIALPMFVLDYGILFSAERTVPSGVASVLLATLPLLTILLEMFLLRAQPFRWRLVLAVVTGFAGTAVLLWPGNGQQLPLRPSIAILVGATGWAVGSVLNRRLDLPASKVVTSGATMLLGGGMLLALAAAAGELRAWPAITWRGVAAESYLILFGSVVGFSAFVWLLARLPATVVSSHAYINPVVAVAAGYLLAGEQVTPRMLAGITIVVASVVLVLRRPVAA